MTDGELMELRYIITQALVVHWIALWGLLAAAPRNWFERTSGKPDVVHYAVVIPHLAVALALAHIAAFMLAVAPSPGWDVMRALAMPYLASTVPALIATFFLVALKAGLPRALDSRPVF